MTTTSTRELTEAGIKNQHETKANSANTLNNWKQLLLSLNAQQIESKKDDILDIIGGINTILNVYTTNNIMNQTQINELYELLSPTSDEKLPSSHYKSASTVSIALADNSDEEYNTIAKIKNKKYKPSLERQFTENVKIQQKSFKLFLNKTNDFWHYLLSNTNEKVADKIVDFTLYSKWSYVMIFFVFILAIICRWALPLFQSIPAALCILWFVTFLLTFNVSMMKKMMQSFVFWYKMYNWLLFIICYILLFNAPILALEPPNWIAGTLAVAAVSSHDACRWSNIVKIYTGLLIWICLIGIYLFVYFEGKSSFFGDHWRFRDEIIMVFNETISVKSTCLNALFNLQLFIGKQVLFKIYYKDKKSSVLSIRPTVIWCDTVEEMNNQLALYTNLNKLR